MIYWHLIADLWVDDRSMLERAEPLQQVLARAAKRAGMKVVAAQFHQFEPHGATGVLLLEQSHVAIHTWAEEGLACVDLMTCGDTDPRLALDVIREALPGPYQVISAERRTPGQGAGWELYTRPQR